MFYNLVNKYFPGIATTLEAGAFDNSVDNFVKGPSPRGGWPIKPYSRSKYAPHQGVKEKDRRLRQMGVVELQKAA